MVIFKGDVTACNDESSDIGVLRLISRSPPTSEEVCQDHTAPIEIFHPKRHYFTSNISPISEHDYAGQGNSASFAVRFLIV
jgi:hypothetical protein